MGATIRPICRPRSVKRDTIANGLICGVIGVGFGLMLKAPVGVVSSEGVAKSERISREVSLRAPGSSLLQSALDLVRQAKERPLGQAGEEINLVELENLLDELVAGSNLPRWAKSQIPPDHCPPEGLGCPQFRSGLAVGDCHRGHGRS